MTKRGQNIEAVKSPDTVDTSVNVLYDNAEKAQDTEGGDEPQSRALGATPNDEVAQFFAANPNAKAVLRVGTSLFLSHVMGSANEFANRNGLTVETIENPNLGETTQTANDTAAA
jgi:hypothetical protein